MVVTNNHKSRVATVCVKTRLPNKKGKLIYTFVVTPGTSLDVQRLLTFPIKVGEHAGSVVISSDLEVQVCL